MSFGIVFLESSKKDLQKHKKAGNKILVDKIKEFAKECQTNPRIGLGKPERLKHFSIEIWSREINKQHRFIYEIVETEILIISLWGHYDDKWSIFSYSFSTKNQNLIHFKT
jgi:toxin YoeB